MGTSFRKPVAASADKRSKIVEASMRRVAKFWMNCGDEPRIYTDEHGSV